MQYKPLIYSTDGPKPQPGAPKFDPFLKGHMDFPQTVTTGGEYEAGETPRPGSVATTILVFGGKTQAVEGRIAETNEQLGSYFVLDCINPDEAIKYAAMNPTARYDPVDVRPVLVFDNP